MATLETLQAKIKKLEQQAEALIVKQASAVIEKIRDLMEKHGLTTADIEAHAGNKQRGTKIRNEAVVKTSPASVKYREPKTGATWSGHGRAPKWIANAKNRDKFLVDGSVASASVAPAGKAKSGGNYVRGPQPTKYRDAKSGATWSGRGRAPAWIAKARDRTKFLISGTTDATVAATAGSPSKAKSVGKKASKAIDAAAGTGQPKGPQVAKYLDRKTGATWSGRGRAPGWLAGAKDRSKFLIEGGTTTS